MDCVNLRMGRERGGVEEWGGGVGLATCMNRKTALIHITEINLKRVSFLSVFLFLNFILYDNIIIKPLGNAGFCCCCQTCLLGLRSRRL